MSYSANKVSDIVVLELEGGMWGDWEDIQLKTHVKSLLDENERKFVVDLGKVDQVNSTGIGILIAALTTVMNANGAFKICGATPRTRRAFGISGVSDVFDAHDSREEALMSLGAWKFGSGGAPPPPHRR
jgi:anti-sigma B factor antagonist